MPPTLYLIDGHALAYRTYFALTGAGANTSRWTTSAGEPTAGVFGFTSVLLRLLEQEDPDYLAVAFDTGKTFRDEIYPEYKATRAKMPDDLRTQINRIRQLVDTLNIPRLELEGYEADDVLGSVATWAAAQGLGVKIITGDKDLLQLVTERIIVTLPKRHLSESQDYTPALVEEKMGVRPDQVVDYKALMGDTSDNIPGVRGVGKKTAAKLLAQYQTLDGVYAHVEEQKPGLRKNLENGRENAYLSQKLARIVTDLDVTVDLEVARTDTFDPQAVEAMFRELEFRTLMKRLNALMQRMGKAPQSPEQLGMFSTQPQTGGEAQPDADLTETHIVDTPESLANLVKTLESASLISFDTETTSTDQMSADLVGIALAVKEGEGYYVPVGHNPGLGAQLPLETVLEALRGPLTNPQIPKIGHNIKYDYVILARYGLEVAPLSFDTMIAEWLHDPASRRLGLKNLAWVRLGAQMTEIETLIGKGKKQITMAEVPIAKAAPYAAADADLTLRLMPEIQKDLESAGVAGLLTDMEMPLVKVLADMEMAGIALDSAFLAEMSEGLETRLTEIAAQVYEAVGVEFNLNSTQQLSKHLFETLEITPPDGAKRTKSGHYSTSAGVLDALRDDHPVVEWVLENRELSKLKSTYVDALPQQVNPQTHRVHTSYNQAGTVTGRIASTKPNLQNIPIRTEIGRRVRRAFVAEPGNALLAVDYSQVELRVVAHMADDQAMIEAFLAGQDIHATTAAAIYDQPLEAVTKEQRRHAKAINFGLIYGMSAFGLTRTTDLTLAEAEDFVETYFKRFPGVKDYLDGMRRLAAEQGYVETLLGRRRYFSALKNQMNRNLRMREEREAINAPIQGTAADILKIAMPQVPGALRKAGLEARILLQVHDELVLECPKEEVSPTAAVVQEVMENAYTLKVPLKTEARAGENWGKMVLVNPE